MDRNYYKLILANIFMYFLFLPVNAQNKEQLYAFHVEKDGKLNFGFINEKSDTIIKPIYAFAFDFREGLAAVRDIKTGKFGYINEKNEIVIPFIYDEAYSFGMGRDDNNGFNNLALVNIGNSKEKIFDMFTDGKWGLINKKGEEVLPIKYGFIYPLLSYESAMIFDGEFIPIKKEDNSYTIEFKGKYGIIDINGKVIVPPIYNAAEPYFSNGVTKVKKDGKTLEINTKGEVIREIVELEEEVSVNSITGVVVDKNTQKPLEGIIVTILSTDISVVTDKEGKFNIKIDERADYKNRSLSIISDEGHIWIGMENGYNVGIIEFENIFFVADKMPEFPGGNNELFNFIRKNTRFSEKDKSKGNKGRVFCSFIIEKDGSTSNVKTVKSENEILNKEAIRLISSLPKFIPAEVDGKPVRFRYNIPISFQ